MCLTRGVKILYLGSCLTLSVWLLWDGNVTAGYLALMVVLACVPVSMMSECAPYASSAPTPVPADRGLIITSPSRQRTNQQLTRRGQLKLFNQWLLWKLFMLLGLRVFFFLFLLAEEDLYVYLTDGGGVIQLFFHYLFRKLSHSTPPQQNWTPALISSYFGGLVFIQCPDS